MKYFSIYPTLSFLLFTFVNSQAKADRLYITDSYYGNNIHVLENGTLVDSWARYSKSEYGIYVDGNIFTMHYDATTGGTRYLLDGTNTGQNYQGDGTGRVYDAATDGYAVFTADAYISKGISVRNRDYTAPELLFSGKFLGVTYDPNTNSLWVNTDSRIENRTFTGELLSSFNANTIGGLAMDYSDGTLWVSESRHGIAQYSQSGERLGQFQVPDSGYLYAGMEFDFAPYAHLGHERSFTERNRGVLLDSGSEFINNTIAEPYPLALLFLGIVPLILNRRKSLQ